MSRRSIADHFQEGFSRTGGNLTAHEDPDLLQPLPLAIEREQRPDLKEAGGNIEALG